MSELPFASPSGFEHLVNCEAPGEGHWFVFRGDQLLVEMGPPDPRPSDDPRVKQRPSWARLPLHKNHNWLGGAALRTLRNSVPMASTKQPVDTASDVWMLIALPATPTVMPLKLRSPEPAML